MKLIPVGTKGLTGSAHPFPSPMPANPPHPPGGKGARAALIPLPHPRQHPFPHPRHHSHRDLLRSAPPVATNHGSSAVRPEGLGGDSEDTGSHGRRLPRPHGSSEGSHQKTDSPPGRRWRRHQSRYPGRSRDSGAPSSGHLQSHREVLPRAGPESGVPGKVERGAEREPQRLPQVEAMTEQVTRYADAKGKGDNAGLMKVNQTLHNLMENYMKDLEADEKDGLSPTWSRCGRRGRLTS
jgi:hypothetical protein